MHNPRASWIVIRQPPNNFGGCGIGWLRHQKMGTLLWLSWLLIRVVLTMVSLLESKHYDSILYCSYRAFV
jgi:hypothetical protein